MQSPRPLYPTEDLSGRSVASSRTAGESQASYQRAAAPRHSLANVSPSTIQSVRRPSEVAVNSGRSVGSSHSGQGWAATSALAGGASPVPRQPPPPQDDEYVLGLLAEPSTAYPAYAAGPGLALATGSVTPPNISLSTGGEAVRGQGSASAPGGGLSPQGDDLVHEVLAINTLAMQRCREEQLDEATNLLNEAYLKLEANGSDANGDAGAAHRPSSAGSTGSRGASVSAGYPAEDASHGPAINDPQLLDELQSITLNNMGVVECHRGQPRQALSHFEAARQLEENWNMGSPSVALNTCAAYNALRMYDKATAAALETIDMLRALAVQRKRQRLLQRRQVESEAPRQLAGGREGGASRQARRLARQKEAEEEALLLQGASEPVIADSENDALWGAAWHNLAVAQINTAVEERRRAGTSNSTRHADTSEMTNTLIVFQNAMRATQDLLGPKHPMTKAVVETYRDARKVLRSGGAFKQHRGQMTAPLPPVDPRDRAMEEMTTVPAPGKTRHGTVQQQKKALTITFRGEATNGEKLVERVDATPYTGAKADSYRTRAHYTASSNFKGDNQRTMTNLPAGRDGRATSTSRSRSGKAKASSRGPLRGMPLGHTLVQASELYGDPHPLLYSSRRPDDAVGASGPPTWSGGGARRGSPTPPSARPDAAMKGARHARPRPPLPDNMSNEAYYQHYLSLLEERERLVQARDSKPTEGETDARLPPLRTASTAAAVDSYPAITDGARTNPPVIMHYPPARASAGATNTTTTASADRVHSGLGVASSVATAPTLDALSANSTAAHFSPDDHARYLLLAQPPTSTSSLPAGQASPWAADTSGTVAGAGAPSGGDPAAGAPSGLSPFTSPPPLSSAAQTDGTASSQSAPAHELFDAMWVATDEAMLPREGKRSFGRPAYYVPTTTLMQTFHEQEMAEEANRQASGRHASVPDTRTAVMYYPTEEQQAGDAADEAATAGDDATDAEAAEHESFEEYTEEEEESAAASHDGCDDDANCSRSGTTDAADDVGAAPRARANTAEHDTSNGQTRGDDVEKDGLDEL